MELPELDAEAIAVLMRLADGSPQATRRRPASEVPDSGRLLARSGS